MGIICLVLTVLFIALTGTIQKQCLGCYDENPESEPHFIVAWIVGTFFHFWWIVIFYEAFIDKPTMNTDDITITLIIVAVALVVSILESIIIWISKKK